MSQHELDTQHYESGDNSNQSNEPPHNKTQVRIEHHMITRSKSGIFKPKIYALTISNESETFDQAIKDKK